MLVAMVLVDMIDPEKVRKSINERLMAFMGRPINGELFCAITDTLVEAINEELVALMNPVFAMQSNVDTQAMNKILDDFNNSTARPVMILHDEVVYASAKTDHLVDAGLDTYAPYDKIEKFAKRLQAESKLMKEWLGSNKTTSVAYCCRDRGCPSRAPVSAQRAPICYTCGKFMEVA